MKDTLTEIFCEIDDFCKLKKDIEIKLLSDKSKKNYPKMLTLSEVMTILVFFHISKYRDFKTYYLYFVKGNLSQEFPRLPSYNRFIELIKDSVIPLLLFMKTCCLGECSGISFIDSTILRVCNNKRIHSHKVFKESAKRGKTTIGWFYGFKLHLVINDKGEILNFMLTPGNVDDRNIELVKKITSNVFGKLFGDKGYISQNLFEILFENGIQLITKLKKNMKQKFIPIVDKVLLRKRAVIETVNNELKNMCYIEHSRHRKPLNWFANLISGLIAYSFFKKKPSLNLDWNLDSDGSVFVS